MNINVCVFYMYVCVCVDFFIMCLYGVYMYEFVCVVCLYVCVYVYLCITVFQYRYVYICTSVCPYRSHTSWNPNRSSVLRRCRVRINSHIFPSGKTTVNIPTQKNLLLLLFFLDVLIMSCDGAWSPLGAYVPLTHTQSRLFLSPKLLRLATFYPWESIYKLRSHNG